VLDEVTRHRFIRELVGMEVNDVLESTTQRITALNPQSPADIQRHTQNVVNYSDELAALNKVLKAFLYQNMYRHYRVVRMSERAEHFLSALFRSYMKEWRQLPREYQDKIESVGVARVVADYIASMTDRGALLEYRHLFDPMMRP
jgi:dGTPase